MWTVLESRKAAKQLDKTPRQIQEKYEFWRLILEHDGPSALRSIRGFRDEALRGERSGQRSSRLNKQWRVIYRIRANTVEVQVLEVNAHEY